MKADVLNSLKCLCSKKIYFYFLVEKIISGNCTWVASNAAHRCRSGKTREWTVYSNKLAHYKQIPKYKQIQTNANKCLNAECSYKHILTKAFSHINPENMNDESYLFVVYFQVCYLYPYPSFFNLNNLSFFLLLFF
jgi:hypothetical protein